LAESDTAVVEQGTAAPAPDTEVSDAIATAFGTDTADGLASDTATQTTPDTGDQPQQTLTPEQLEEKLKEEREKWETEQRSKIEDTIREQAAVQRRLQSEQLRTGQTAQAFASIAKWAYDQGEQGKDFRFDPRSVQQIAAQMEAGIFQDQSDSWSMAFSKYLSDSFKDFRPSRANAERLERAFRDWNPDEAVNAQFATIEEAVRSQLESKIRKEIEEELKQKNTSAGKTQALKEADAQRRAGGRPTGIGEAGGNAPDLASIIGNPSVPLSERRKAYKSVYGITPPF